MRRKTMQQYGAAKKQLEHREETAVEHDLELLGLVRMPPTLVALTVAFRMSVRRASRSSGDIAAAVVALQAAYYRLTERV